jgi:hypothetical protein
MHNLLGTFINAKLRKYLLNKGESNMTLMRNAIALCILLALNTMMLGCAGTMKSGYTYNDNIRINTPQKGESCYDASVLLGVDLKQAMDIAKKVISGLDATINKETANSIEAQRNRHFGVMVGSGGEEIVVELKKIDDTKTFVTAATKTGFVGAVGQKAWSCEIVDQMVKMASK